MDNIDLVKKDLEDLKDLSNSIEDNDDLKSLISYINRNHNLETILNMSEEELFSLENSELRNKIINFVENDGNNLILSKMIEYVYAEEGIGDWIKTIKERIISNAKLNKNLFQKISWTKLSNLKLNPKKRETIIENMKKRFSKIYDINKYRKNDIFHGIKDIIALPAAILFLVGFIIAVIASLKYTSKSIDNTVKEANTIGAKVKALKQVIENKTWDENKVNTVKSNIYPNEGQFKLEGDLLDGLEYLVLRIEEGRLPKDQKEYEKMKKEVELECSKFLKAFNIDVEWDRGREGRRLYPKGVKDKYFEKTYNLTATEAGYDSDSFDDIDEYIENLLYSCIYSGDSIFEMSNPLVDYFLEIVSRNKENEFLIKEKELIKYKANYVLTLIDLMQAYDSAIVNDVIPQRLHVMTRLTEYYS